jgi:hypothetical protein
MAAWTREDVKNGKISAEAAEKIFNELSTPLAERSTVDTRTDEQKALDQAFPPADPTAYTIRYSRPGQDTPVTEEIKQFDANARTWMSSAGLPRELGNSLVNQIDRVSQHTATMTPEQLVVYGEREFVKLQNLYGAGLEDKLKSAALMIHELDQKKPGLKQLLRTGGIGDNALIVSQLIAQSERYHARKVR